MDRDDRGPRRSGSRGEAFPVDDGQGLVYTVFIEAELKAERERRAGLDTRGAALVTTSSGLVTLLAAVGAFVIRGDRFVLPSAAKVPLLVALIAFAAAAACGIMSTSLHKYTVADVRDLENMRTNHWKDNAVESRSVTTYLNIKTIDSLRKKSDRKVRWLRAGQLAQLAALVALALVIFTVLATGSPMSQTPGPILPSPLRSTPASGNVPTSASPSSTP